MTGDPAVGASCVVKDQTLELVGELDLTVALGAKMASKLGSRSREAWIVFDPPGWGA
jgi:hypothetical protein